MKLIGNNSNVTLQYRLTFDTAEGELIEETTEDDDVKFKFGNQEMLDAFESKIEGLKAGDEFEFLLTPSEAYGEVQDMLLVEYPKEQFLVEGELDEDFLQPGEIIEMTDEEENIFEGIIDENKVNSVIVDFNHPLAGETLYFKGTIVEVS